MMGRYTDVQAEIERHNELVGAVMRKKDAEIERFKRAIADLVSVIKNDHEFAPPDTHIAVRKALRLIQRQKGGFAD